MGNTYLKGELKIIKNKKTVFLLSLVMILISTANVFAEDLILPEESFTKQDGKYYEYDQEMINESVKKDNEKAEMKWNEMLKNEGITENDPSVITVNNNSYFNNLIVPYAFKSATVSKYYLFTGEDYIFNSTFNTIKNGNGVDIEILMENDYISLELFMLNFMSQAVQ